MQNREYLYIDKTESLEEGIGRFPSIYIEGSAASGKTTAVKMLIKNHPEIDEETAINYILYTFGCILNKENKC